MDSAQSVDLLTRIQHYLDSDPSGLRRALDMDDDDSLATPLSPVDELTDSSTDSEGDLLEKQRAALRTYVDSLPYPCESLEEMDRKFAEIVHMIYISSKANRLDLLREWDGVLSTWLLMKYPITKASRVKLLKYYYELCVIPAESHLLNERIRMFSALLPPRRDSVLSIGTDDLILDWRPLWRVVRKELWPTMRSINPSRNAANLYLQLAELSKRFFPAREIKNILEAILPLLGPDTFLSIIPVLTCFIPLSSPQDYLAAFFSIWEAFNSNIVDERMIELMADLAEEHVSGSGSSPGTDGVTRWRDVGIWTEKQWIVITGKCLGAMNVPVGGAKGPSTTGGHADMSGIKNELRIKKPVNKNHALAKLFVYSMSTDGPVRDNPTRDNTKHASSTGFLAGSRALDSLDKIITSAETFFHPSNSGPWTLSVRLSSFLQRLASEFCKRWKEEEDPKCKTPMTQRLTMAIRQSFILTLRNPLLFTLFSKDTIAMGFAQAALRSMALLEPGLVMPQLLERAYGGLEVVNETHRTTAVLSMLSGVALPLVSERIWPGGQRHLVPLLELCLPGIDVNDPSKTICATTFICYALQHIKIGDLSMHAYSGGLVASDDGALDGMQMDLDGQHDRLPDGADSLFAVLGTEDERALVRDSTAGFADWVTSLFRRVFALYENLPEEGGRRNTTGGKTEETVLKSIKNMLDVVCLHLSDPLFDLVLRLVFEYATTNTRSNAVRVIGQLVACLARAKPQLTIDKFLPYCLQQIKEELRYGASSIRTTSSHAAVPSDTTLHWNLSLLRGCTGYGGVTLLRHKDSVLELLSVLVDKTKSERGFSGTGRLISRLLYTLSGVYPINSRFTNTDEWQSDGFEKNHSLQWGRFYDVKDVKIEWHVPSDEEISFVLQILDEIASPLLNNLEGLLTDTSNWDDVMRNDFCRYLYAVRSIWAGLPTLLQESEHFGDPEMRDEQPSSTTIGPSCLRAQSGFCLTNQGDPRYQAAMKHRGRFGHVIHHAATSMRGNVDGEDHIDAVIGVVKSIDTYLLEYGTSRSAYVALQKNYALVRDVNKMWPRQKENSRLVFLKRAQVYHNARLATHSINRCRTEFDVLLFDDLIEFSLSPYTRVRRHGQSVLFSATASYPLSARFVLPRMTSALVRGAEPDRMKGALYILLHKNYRSVIRHNHSIMVDLLISLLESHHQEKPSIQKLIPTVHHEIIRFCNDEESWRDYSPLDKNTRLYLALDPLKDIFPDTPADAFLLREMGVATTQRNEDKEKAYRKLVAYVTETSRRPTTHWRYLQMAILSLPLRRDQPALPDVAAALVRMTIESHPSTRIIAQRSLVKILGTVKLRSYSKNDDEMWLEEWRNPLQEDVEVKDAPRFVSFLQQSLVDKKPPLIYVDKVTSGFLFWKPVVKAYRVPPDSSMLQTIWESQSRPALREIGTLIAVPSYFSRLLSLWSQEADAKGALSTEINLRSDNMLYMKTLAKMFEEKILDKLLPELETLLSDSNRFSQRAAAEALAGVLRGSKHWPGSPRKILWDWFMSRVSGIMTQIKPDTVTLWEMFFKNVLERLDPNRNRALVDWILSLPLEFHSDSAFAMSKTLSIFATLANEMGIRFADLSERYINLLFDNAHTGYAEIRSGIAQALHLLMICEWNAGYPSLDSFLSACENENDPLQIRRAKYLERITQFSENLPAWRLERLPPPRVSQSQFDKVSLTLLSWIWAVGHSSEASTMFAYVMPLLPEILKMTELNDNRELMMYSSGVLFILSAVTPPHEYVETIVYQCISAIKDSSSYKIKLVGLPMLTLFYFRNLVGVSDACVERVMEVVISCLADENIEVREMAKKILSGLLRCSQRRQILPLRDRFVAAVRKTKLPRRQDAGYADALRTLHSAILGICALMESFPYSIEPWMPPLTEVLAPHASDPPPISTTIRKTASEFKKTHQDTWHVDQLLFNEDQLQDLSSMLIGTSYYA